VESICGGAAVRLGVHERSDHVEEVQLRARVRVGQEQRGGVRVPGADVQEVDPLAVDFGEVAVVGVQPSLDGAPVEGLPTLDHVAEVRRRRSVLPGIAGHRGGEPGAVQPGAQVVQVGLRDVDDERGDLRVHVLAFRFRPRFPSALSPTLETNAEPLMPV
jgi:hypothetical protein